MDITNEEIKSHLNYSKPSDVTSMNIKSEEIDSQFHWRQFHNFRVRFVCIRLREGGGEGVGLDWESLDFDCEIMIYNKTGRQKKIQRQKLRPRILGFPFSTDFWTIRETIRYAKLFSWTAPYSGLLRSFFR